MNERQRDAYREEAAELLLELEAALLELEESPRDADLVGRVFRALHTIKGSGAMFGFDRVAEFTHEVESVFDHVREGRLEVTGELINLTLEARDHIRLLLESGEDGESGSEQQAAIMTRLRELAPAAESGAREAPPETPADGGDPVTYRIHFTPPRNCFLAGTNLGGLLGELAGLGDASTLARTDRIPLLEALDPEQCYTSWDVVLTTTAGIDAIRDVFIFVEEESELTIETVGPAAPRVRLVEEGPVPRRREDGDGAASSASVRVPAEKLDTLVNIVGELVTLQARMTDLAAAVGHPEMAAVAEEMERLTERLRDNTMSVRMLPIAAAFSHARRLVRDLANDLGKSIQLRTEGEETELDKTVIERLADPLMHLIRNAVDHGIESPDRRRSAGKPERGTVTLAAEHVGAHVLIHVSDDGAGLNREAIRSRALEAGLIAFEANLSDAEIDRLILEPGFSTAEQVTGISGRGVGMDVVNRGIEALRGSLSVQSRTGAGCTFTLKLPLTLAIIDGLLIEIAGRFYVVPLASILECMEVRPGGATGGGVFDRVSVRGEMVGCLRLRPYFGIEGEPPEIQQVVIAETHSGKIGLIVDRVIGDHQTVIKTLGGLYRRVDMISGATILGDGTVALILDVDRLFGEIDVTGDSRPGREERLEVRVRPRVA